ncbi:uncharacterized protein C12orf29 homolog [Protopterus annectens]|uniref:uncharacterized protein C12orf29 homolog n=1 Tax=Protopterus annectens TaxID=7888 RepID=UPI001CF9D858|nr:uncharacterized protein C12orf29 homolog [Protopterus annectens]
MQRLGSVQQKIPCLFLTDVKDDPSTKREYQPFRVLATEQINPKALDGDIYNAIPTEKVDGTCCCITRHKGQPYLWARLDRKPNKQAEKRFKNFHRLGSSKEFIWNVEQDFKTVPDSWIPAAKMLQLNGNVQPDENGHIPGWVPVEKYSKQYCWHSSVVDYEAEVALVLRPESSEQNLLEITIVPLSDLLEQTVELIGTNVNANPYSLGSKKHPIHLLVSHGTIPVQNPPALNQKDLISWFQESKEGEIEGIVWHCTDGTLVKIHRHHLGLKWPLPDTYLSSHPVVINVDLSTFEHDFESKSSFTNFSKLNGQRFEHLKDIHFDNA